MDGAPVLSASRLDMHQHQQSRVANQGAPSSLLFFFFPLSLSTFEGPGGEEGIVKDEDNQTTTFKQNLLGPVAGMDEDFILTLRRSLLHCTCYHPLILSFARAQTQRRENEFHNWFRLGRNRAQRKR